MGGINSGHCQRGELQVEEAVGEREREKVGVSGDKDSDIIDIHWIWRPFAPDAQTESPKVF